MDRWARRKSGGCLQPHASGLRLRSWLFSLRVFLLAFTAACCISLKAVGQDQRPAGSLDHDRIQTLESELEQLNAPNPSVKDWDLYRSLSKSRDEASGEAFKSLFRNMDELHAIEKSEGVRERIHKISKMDQELKALKVPIYCDIERKGRELCEERHRQLAAQIAPPTPHLRELGLDILSFPKIDGSTSTQPLATLIACRHFDLPVEWIGRIQLRDEDARRRRVEASNPLGGGFGPVDAELQLAEYTLSPASPRVEDKRVAGIVRDYIVSNAATHEAYVNIIQGTSGLGLLARGPSQKERELARAAGVELEVVPCALDAFVFIVAIDSPVLGLSRQQIRDIYSGKATSWSQFDPQHQRRIIAYRRPKNSGSEELMESLVMKETPMPPALSSVVGSLMSSVFLELTNKPDGIAYSVRYYEHFMAGSAKTRTIAVDGIIPNYETIETRSYPFVAEVYAVIRHDSDANAPPRRLLEWLLTLEGQSVVKQSGYVPISH